MFIVTKVFECARLPTYLKIKMGQYCAGITLFRRVPPIKEITEICELMLYLLGTYRGKKDSYSRYIRGHVKLEVLWYVIFVLPGLYLVQALFNFNFKVTHVAE